MNTKAGKLLLVCLLCIALATGIGLLIHFWI